MRACARKHGIRSEGQGRGVAQLTGHLGNSYRGKLGRGVFNQSGLAYQAGNRARVNNGAAAELAYARWTLKHRHLLLQHHTHGSLGVVQHALGVRRLCVIVHVERILGNGAAHFSNLFKVS